MIAGFRKFVVQGNVVDIAVGVVIGAAFAALIKQFTESFITPLIKMISGAGPTGGTFTINGQVFDYSAFFSAVITFVITAAVIYFAVVVPMNALKNRRNAGVADEDVPPTPEERMVELLEQIAQK
ncbi:MAG: MscL family protein [Acidimicrobiia bacterium]|nr:MscL family protein [Acidimicrobiia bacterium]